MKKQMPACRNGRRGRLKICCGQPRAGSSPAAGRGKVRFSGFFLWRNCSKLFQIIYTAFVANALEKSCFFMDSVCRL